MKFFDAELRSLVLSGAILTLGVTIFHWSLGPVFFLLWAELAMQLLIILLRLGRSAVPQRGTVMIILVFFYVPSLTFLFLLAQMVSAGSFQFLWERSVESLSIWLTLLGLLISPLYDVIVHHETTKPLTIPGLSRELFGRILALLLAGMVAYGFFSATASVLLFVVLFTVTSILFGFLIKAVQLRHSG